MLKDLILYSFPHDTRRALFSKLKPQKFEDMQYMRSIDTKDSFASSYKPFDRHRCIFVHIPKTAGVSICRALFGNLAGAHIPLARYQLVFSKKEFNSYFKFTFVRNPWDRVFSAYNFLKKGGLLEVDRSWAEVEIAPYQNFDDFIKTGLHRPSIQEWKHFKPQSHFLLVPGSRKLQVDFLGFFENIQNDFQYVATELGLGDSAVLRHENATNPSKKLDYRDFYTDKTRDIVAEIYKIDIDNFGYEFNNSSLQFQLANRQQQLAYL